MWPLLEKIFEYISFKHTWEDGTHRTEFKCENCYKIVDIGQINEISYESETYTTGCFNAKISLVVCKRKTCLPADLLANSLDYPQRMRIEWSQCSNSVSVLCLSVSKFSHFPLSTFSFYTVQYRRV